MSVTRAAYSVRTLGRWDDRMFVRESRSKIPSICLIRSLFNVPDSHIGDFGGLRCAGNGEHLIGCE